MENTIASHMTLYSLVEIYKCSNYIFIECILLRNYKLFFTLVQSNTTP
jgi:hypothetical protein